MQDFHPTTKPNSNRKHKDSLFVDYFSKDRDWKKHFLSSRIGIKTFRLLHKTKGQEDFRLSP